jgi:diguanylate cyclase (GGDEF)-like protein
MDPYTGLPNRRALREDSHRGAFDATHAAYIDLNDFGSINRVVGHAAGDTALGVIGDRCRDVPSQDGIVYRIGGDEFALLASGPPARVAQTLAQLLGQIKLPIASIDQRCVTATAGVVAILEGEEWEDAVGRAHTLFIRERDLGSDRFNTP